jgi:hypothetical protein
MEESLTIGESLAVDESLTVNWAVTLPPSCTLHLPRTNERWTCQASGTAGSEDSPLKALLHPILAALGGGVGAGAPHGVSSEGVSAPPSAGAESTAGAAGTGSGPGGDLSATAAAPVFGCLPIGCGGGLVELVLTGNQVQREGGVAQGWRQHTLHARPRPSARD